MSDTPNTLQRTPHARGVAVVTGGTRGIGLGIARALAADGWHLALCGVRPEDQVREVLGELGNGSAEAAYFAADVARPGDRRALVEGVLRRFGRIDALVNNAGRAPRVRADLLEASEDSFEEVLQTNLQGPYFLTQAVARVMIERAAQSPTSTPYMGQGFSPANSEPPHVAQGFSPADSQRPRAIVFVTSVSAEMASVNRGEYCVSKAGLAMAARLFAVRLAPHGIPVFEVRPGIVATDMTARVKDAYDQRIADGLVPEARWGQPEDVGRVVAALLRGDAPYATGSVIHVDGGLAIPRL